VHGPRHLVESRERVEDLGGADRNPLPAQFLTELQELGC
jgi:hypothetical protein